MKSTDPANTPTKQTDREKEHERGLDDQATSEIMSLIEDLKDDDPNENAKEGGKGVTDKKYTEYITNPSNNGQTKEQDKEPSLSKKSSELIRWKAEQISDLLENYISCRETQNWS